MKKIKQKISDIKYSLMYPYGKSSQWDLECDESFLNLLDNLYIFFMILIFITPVTSILFLIAQNI